MEMYDKQADMKHEQIFEVDANDDDADATPPMDEETDDVPDDDTCNELCLCNASVLSTKI